MKYILLFSICCSVFLISCTTNKIKTIEGRWKQELISYKTKTAELPKTSEQAIIDIQKEKRILKIEFDFNDGYEKDQTDSVVFNYPQLKFRKINLDKSSNYYNLNYQPNCDCFVGEMNSFSGNILNIKLNRVSTTK